MEYKGSHAYDEQEFLASYLKRRSRPDSPNNAIEGPIINGLLGSVTSTHILDMGCGDGKYGRELLEKGAKTYTGVDGSSAMIKLAYKNLADHPAELVHSSMENFEYPDQKYDLVISRMAIHYVENLDTLFLSINKTLKQDARFLFSVQHPLTTSSFKSKSKGERKGD